MILIYRFISTLSLLTFSVYSTKFEYTALQNDIYESRRSPIISGRPLEPGQAKIVLGFLANARVPHAYLVFEFMKPNGEIVLRGLHFGGGDYCLGYHQGQIDLCAGNSTEIRTEDAHQVLRKFHRALEQEYEDTPEGRVPVGQSQIVGGTYQKLCSFNATYAAMSGIWAELDAWRGPGTENAIRFSTFGDVFSKNSHNCCSFVTLCLQKAGIPIKYKGLWARSPSNLEFYVKEFLRENPTQGQLY